MTLTTIFTYLSGFAFIGYGVSCIYSRKIQAEFKRYGLSNYRVFVGVLELLGGIGLCLGQICQWPRIVLVSSLGLGVMMMFGMVTRIRLKDSLLETLPAIILCLINLWIAMITWGVLQ